MSIKEVFHNSLEHGWYGISSTNHMMFLHDHHVPKTCSLDKIRGLMLKYGYEELPIDNYVRSCVQRLGYRFS